MEERELRKIERRNTSYPVQAQRDILRLMRGLRRRKREIERQKKPRLHALLYDSETGLPNGAACGIRFAVARARAARCKTIVAVMFVDLTFPRNDNCSNLSPRSDATTLMRAVECLKSAVRITDTVAHIGGLRFAIILEDLIRTSDARRVKTYVQKKLGKQISLDKSGGIAHMHMQVRFYSGSRKSTRGERRHLNPSRIDRASDV